MTERPVLLAVYADPREGADVAAPQAVACVEVGVGKVAAALGTYEAVERLRPAAVLSFGLCGTYDPGALPVGAGCRVREAVLGDEGARTPRGFADLADLGLGEPPVLRADGRLSDWVESVAGPLAPVRAATVSACAGTDALAADRAARLGAQIETMETYGIAAACARRGVPWAEVRVVSNETGDRDRARFDLSGAARRCRGIVAAILDAWRKGGPPWTA